MRKCHIYTEDEKQFLAKVVPGHSYAEIREAFIKEFGWEISVGQIKGSIMRYGLNTGRSGQFPKGNVPLNKGKKMSPEVYEKCKGTMFKKGQTPVNRRAVGSERVTVDGYVEIKVAEPNKWKLKHRVVWEQHNGPLPRYDAIVFLYGNSLNTDISNLKHVTRKELLLMNQNHLFSDDADITNVGVNLVKLINKTNEAEGQCK